MRKVWEGVVEGIGKKNNSWAGRTSPLYIVHVWDPGK